MAVWMALLGSLLGKNGGSGGGGGGSQISNPIRYQPQPMAQPGHQMAAQRFRLSDEGQKCEITSARARLREAMRFIAETEGEEAVNNYALQVGDDGSPRIIGRHEMPAEGYQTDGNINDATFGKVRLRGGNAEFDDERRERAVEAARKLDPVSYQYRDSVPQELATADRGKTTVGNTTQQYQDAGLGGLVRDTPQGEVVDTGGVAQAGLAAAATNRQDLDKLQGDVGKLRRLLG